MQKFATLAVLALCLLAVNTQAAENPLKNAKVGDWVEYVQAVNANGKPMEITMKQSVTAKDDASVTMKMEMSVGGRAIPGQEFKIDLTKEYNPLSPRSGVAKPEIIEQGDEALSIGGKEYKCHWMSVKSSVDGQGGQASKFEGKVWVCPDVPLGGMVKMEGKVESSKGPMDFKKELSGSGRGQ